MAGVQGRLVLSYVCRSLHDLLSNADVPEVVIDTMTSSGFSGNPTPVIVLDSLDSWPSVDAMQLLASEMQQSETCFVRRITPDDPERYAIRWFTPTKEEIFCGHAVVAGAIALWQASGQQNFAFQSFSGIKTKARILHSRRVESNMGLPVSVMIEFPSCPVDSIPCSYEAVRASFAQALEIETDQILFLGTNSLKDIVVELNPSVDFSDAKMMIDPAKMLNASPPGTRSQVITSASHLPGVDFVKRVFAYGGEDQATGSTYCVLAPYWAQKLGKRSLKARQISLRLGSANLCVRDDTGVVEIEAQGVRVMAGEILLPFQGLPVRRPKSLL